MRRHIMLGTAGHVDHGKSALVKLLTGCETDTLAEEKQRGLTIDLGFAPCRLADQRVVGIVDVPGHVDFIRNMVAGAQGIDVVIFVVAADDGIMPQTLEHLQILTLMGLKHGLVALTKTDLVDAGRREQVSGELRRLLADTFLAEAPICPISNVTGEGFDQFFEALNQAVDLCGDRPCHGPFRLWVEDAFSIRGAGTVVTGIPTHGRIETGHQLHLLPAGVSARVRRLQVYGEDAIEARAGACVALNVPELAAETVRRGMTLVEKNGFEPATMAEAELRLLPDCRMTLADNAELQFHVGTAAVTAKAAMLERPELAPGEQQFVQFRFAEPLPLVPGERFVVRANSARPGVAGLATVGGGQILGLNNVRLPRRKPWILQPLAARRIAVADPVRWCEQMLNEGSATATIADLQKKCWSTADEISGALEKLRGQGNVIAAGDGWMHRRALEQAAESVRIAVEKFHAANPQRAGVAPEELRAALPLSPAVFDATIRELLGNRQLERNGTGLARTGWSSRVPAGDLEAGAQIARVLQQARFTPPDAEALATTRKEPPRRTLALLALLVERGDVVRITDRIWMHRDAVEESKQIALKLFRAAPTFSTMAFRDALGVSRKFAVPLVDYLDRIRFTARSGNQRRPGSEAKKLLEPVVTP